MEFGSFAQGAVPEPLRKKIPDLEHQRMMDSVELAVRSEEYGFKYAWASEHHFLEEYSHMAAPEVFGAFVAARTKTLHVGAAITNITPKVNHPARVASTFATMDHLTEGRYELGTGRGSSTTEMGGFGIEDWDSTRGMWLEALQEIPKMWTQDRYSHEGEHFSMTERNVVPKLYSDTPPPMWVAAGNPETFEIAARHGLGVLCFAFGPPKKSKIPAAIEVYKKTIEKAEPPSGVVNDNICCVTNLVCHEDREKAFQLSTEIGMSYYHSLVLKWLDTFPRPKGIPMWPELLPEPTVEEAKKLSADGAVVIGDADDCEAATRIYEDIGVSQLVFSPFTTMITRDDALHSFKVFGENVIPKFDKDPVHSTTRYRQEAATRS